jgi:endonuclease YncB( thermonuclease family)
MPQASRSGKLSALRLTEANWRCEPVPVPIPPAGILLRIKAAFAAIALLVAATDIAAAAGCEFEPQGEGRVTAVTDGRSFRLQDGREIRLAGIAPAASEEPTRGKTLATMLIGREVRLRGEDDAPDRYGRQVAFVWLLPSETMVQTELLTRGEALVSTGVGNKECIAALFAAEAKARDAKKGLWADPMAIKNAESPGVILAGIGRFALVEGRVLSVRQAGATTYLNFGQNWTRDFAVTIPRQALAVFAVAGLVPKSLENKRIRVRGIVEARNGPRIELLQMGQIELLSGN